MASEQQIQNRQQDNATQMLFNDRLPEAVPFFPFQIWATKFLEMGPEATPEALSAGVYFAGGLRLLNLFRHWDGEGVKGGKLAGVFHLAMGFVKTGAEVVAPAKIVKLATNPESIELWEAGAILISLGDMGLTFLDYYKNRLKPWIIDPLKVLKMRKEIRKMSTVNDREGAREMLSHIRKEDLQLAYRFSKKATTGLGYAYIDYAGTKFDKGLRIYEFTALDMKGHPTSIRGYYLNPDNGRFGVSQEEVSEPIV